MFTFLSPATVPDHDSSVPVLCEDIRWYLCEYFLLHRKCRMCDRQVVFPNGRVRMCIVRDETMCFECFQKSRYPRVN